MTQDSDEHADPPGASRRCWVVREQEPTNLIALWPDVHPPTVTEVLTALSAHLQHEVEVLKEVDPGDANVAWCLATRIACVTAPVVLWCEPARSMALDELSDARATASKWVVGMETLLSASDPLTDFANLVELVAGALPDVPAVLDVNTARWHERRALDEIFACAEVQPPADVLWVIQAVQSIDESAAGASLVWLHTHGLWRCGAPELEMLEVPLACAESAAELINDIAALLLEQEPPPPGEPFEIGTDLHVTLQRWQEIAPRLADGVPGSMVDRVDDGENPHVDLRAVICALEPAGGEPPLWLWPREVTERLMHDDAGVYMTRHATDRQARLAQAAWAQLATAYASVGDQLQQRDEHGEPIIVFGIKAGFSEEHDESSREHLWFQICQLDGDRAQGHLVNQPFAVRRLKKGDCVWISREQVSDWQVMTEDGCFGPNDTASLWRAIDAIKQRRPS